MLTQYISEAHTLFCSRDDYSVNPFCLFIMTAKTSRHLKKAYEGEEATLLVNQSLAMTSIGVCLLSEIKGIPLDERLSGKNFNDNKNWTKENLLRVLIDINKILNS